MDDLVKMFVPLLTVAVIALVGLVVKSIWSWISKGRMAEIHELIDLRDKECSAAHAKLHQRIDEAVMASELKARSADDRLLRIETQRQADSEGIKHLEDRMTRFEEKLDAARNELRDKIDSVILKIQEARGAK